VRDARERAGDRVGVEEDLALRRHRDAHRAGTGSFGLGTCWVIRDSFPASLDRVKGVRLDG
jgi:hypothetical protein